MLTNLKKFIFTGHYKVTRSDGDSEISFSTYIPTTTRSQQYIGRNPSSEEAQELLFHQNESLSSISSSHRSFSNSTHGTRYREGSFDLEMGSSLADLTRDKHKD